MSLRDRVAMVTGATGGIGKAITFELAREGYHVIAVGRSTAVLNEMQATNGVRPLALDITDREAMAAALNGEKIDVLVNNAGIIPPVIGFADMDQSDINTALEVNLSAPIAITRLVLPDMIARGAGHIFFTGSTAGHAPFPNMAVYGASKAAISSFASAFSRLSQAGSKPHFIATFSVIRRAPTCIWPLTPSSQRRSRRC